MCARLCVMNGVGKCERDCVSWTAGGKVFGIVSHARRGGKCAELCLMNGVGESVLNRVSCTAWGKVC